MSIDAQPPEASSRALWSAVALQLALDAATVETVEALNAEGIRSLLLKGASVAARLYDEPGQRTYCDFDLLVHPAQLRAAEAIVTRLGYTIPLANARERWASHDIECIRGPVTLDLHHRLFLTNARPADVWAVLSADTRWMTVSSAPVEVLGDAALALVIAAHVVHHPSAPQPRQDLLRALARFDRPVWERTRTLAEQLDMADVLAAGLRKVARGQALAETLELPAVSSAALHVQLKGLPPLTDGLVRVAHAGSPAAAIRVLVSELVPSPAFMRHTRPLARRGWIGLLLAYLQRTLWLMINLPRALSLWREGRVRVPAEPSRRRLSLDTVRAAVWAWRAGSSARRQLRAGGLDAVSLPLVPALGRQAERGVRVVLTRRPLSCLERSIVRQRWYAEHGDQRDLIIGVHHSRETFGAHAWLDGDPDGEGEQLVELLRRPARS
jgi:hypothetical protein